MDFDIPADIQRLLRDLDEFIEQTNTEAVMRWLGGVWPREGASP